jgi:hypothetical protein
MLTLIMTLAISQSGVVNKPLSQQSSSTDIPTVEFCQLNGQYKNKVVRVRALYRSGFEESSLYSPNCYVPNLVWVKFDPSHRSCTKKNVQKKLDKIKDGQSVDVVFIGRLETEGDGAGGYGHMDMYAMQFVVTCVEEVKPSGKFRPLPDEKK